MPPREKKTPDYGSTEGAIRRRLPVDDDWRRRARAALKAMGGGQHSLAAHINAPQSAISQALSLQRSQGHSEHAHAISLAVGVELPALARILVAAHRLETEGSERQVEQLEKFAAVLESLVPVSPPDGE